MYEQAPTTAWVIDDFQTQPSAGVSSSGGRVFTDLRDLTEGLLNDPDNDFNFANGQAMNGMTQAGPGDTGMGSVFSWKTDRFLIFDVLPAGQDMSDRDYLSFRACQLTRDPDTDAAAGDLVFDVTLKDIFGTRSTIRIDAYGGGIEEPYQRFKLSSGFFGFDCGDTGLGWANEFETVRLRLDDFRANGSGIDLTQITKVGFEFGPSHGSALGAIGFDNLEVVAD